MGWYSLCLNISQIVDTNYAKNYLMFKGIRVLKAETPHLISSQNCSLRVILALARPLDSFNMNLNLRF